MFVAIIVRKPELLVERYIRRSRIKALAEFPMTEGEVRMMDGQQPGYVADTAERAAAQAIQERAKMHNAWEYDIYVGMLTSKVEEPQNFKLVDLIQGTSSGYDRSPA